ncbi:MAG TPA: TerB family tellurite resistance protein [Kiloniellales bacterium]
MINRLKALFRERHGWPAAAGHRHDANELRIALAALLVEAAQMDDTFDARERAKVLDLVTQRFDLSREEALGLLVAAEEQVARSSQLHGFTRVVNKAFDQVERIELLEMLWEVTYADGELHDYEASLMRRLTGLLHVSDQESAAARNRALARLGKI